MLKYICFSLRRLIHLFKVRTVIPRIRIIVCKWVFGGTMLNTLATSLYKKKILLSLCNKTSLNVDTLFSFRSVRWAGSCGTRRRKYLVSSTT